MEKTDFHSLISHYHDRQFKQWLIISGFIFGVTLLIMLFFTGRALVAYNAAKRRYEAHTHEKREPKKECRNTHNNKEKKQKENSCKAALSDALLAISKAIPDHTHLTKLIIGKAVTLKGQAPEMQELAHFASNLTKEKFTAVVIQETVQNNDGFCFEITAKI